jgi:hypothetical protein
MTRGLLLVALIALPCATVLGALAQAQGTKSTLHTVVKTKGDVEISKVGDKSILSIDLRKRVAESKSYPVEGDYEIVTDGAVRETTVAGQRILEVFSPPAAQAKALSGDCSGPCCLAGDDHIGYRCLRFCKPPASCRLHSSPGNRYCSCD